YIITILLFFSCSKNSHSYDFSKSCKKTSNFSLENRLKNYPFNISKKIVFIYYIENNLKRERKPNGTQLTNYLNELKARETKFYIHDVHQAYVLNNTNIDELTNLFYNIGENEGTNVTMMISGCFYYKNAILFLDENNYLIDYIKFSFDCRREESSNSAVTTGKRCTYKFNLIENFFNKYAIRTISP
ncbi:hypothetical protein, partial [Chishuiella changwenlii]|uniref:hypothetical protein n=1 Tax=Chishuiella changwenlii TaxID=1434701 RepID=UPI00166B179E